MKINVRIERLILEGLPVTPLQGPKAQRAVEEELARLLASSGLLEELRSGAALPRVKAGTLSLLKESHPITLGKDIARAVHEGIGDPAKQRCGTTSVHGARRNRGGL